MALYFISVCFNRNTRGNCIPETYLTRKAVDYHLDNICQTVSAKNIIHWMFTRELLNHEEYDDLILKIKPFKPTGQAKMLFQFLLEPKNDSKFAGLMGIIENKHPDIYKAINHTTAMISSGEIQMKQEQKITGR